MAVRRKLVGTAIGSAVLKDLFIKVIETGNEIKEERRS
jgi:hypothetical protein